MQFPLAPSSAIDWNNLDFRVREVNGHVECHFSTATGQWSKAEFVQDPLIKLHGLSPALNYGTQAYEGLKAFRSASDGQIRLFRPDLNAARMTHSLRAVSIPEIPPGLFLQCVHLAVARNSEFVPPAASGASLYCRPVAFGSSAHIGMSSPSSYTFCVYVLPLPAYYHFKLLDGLIIENFDRAAPEGAGSAKIGGNYGPVLRHIAQAQKEGYGITLHLDSKTRDNIEEFSTSAFLAVKKKNEGEENPILVVSDSRQIVQSITAQSVCEIAKSLGWWVEKRQVAYSELEDFDEVMAAGTAAALAPIRSLERKSLSRKTVFKTNGDEPGPYFNLLSSHLLAVQKGTAKDTFGWMNIVSAPQQ